MHTSAYFTGREVGFQSDFSYCNFSYQSFLYLLNSRSRGNLEWEDDLYLNVEQPAFGRECCMTNKQNHIYVFRSKIVN